MPSLNVSKYIDECLNSVLNQTLKDIEIIAVDAGSTDGTLEIIESYAAKDNRIKIINADKKSYGYQMNLGLAAAIGEYVGIVETDDMIEPNMYEVLVKYADEYELDYAKGYARAFVELTNGGRYYFDIDRYIVPKGTVGTVINPSKMPELLLMVYHIWLGVYRRSFLHDVRFNETAGAAYQDIGFILQTLPKATRAISVDMPVYQYRQGHIGASVYNPKGMHYIKDEYCQLLHHYKNLSANFQKYFYSRMYSQMEYRFRLMAITNHYWNEAEEDILASCDILREANKRELIAYEDLGNERHALLRLMTYSPSALFEYFSKIYQKKLVHLKKLLQWATGKDILVWGCGKWGKFIQTLFIMNGVNVVAFVDSNPLLWGQIIQGTEVMSPFDVKKLYSDKYFFIAVKNYVDEIKQELSSWEVLSERIFYQKIEIDPTLFLVRGLL